MIKKDVYTNIRTKVEKYINDTLDSIKDKSFDNYILFLLDAEPKNKHGYFEYCYKDDNRIRFLTEFLNIFYNFSPPQDNVGNDEYRFHLELMIYTHIWESKPFLKKLYRLAHLDNSAQYLWEVSVPEKDRYKFFNDIQETFKRNNNPLSEVIEEGYHTSLRNAFAHSEYSFDLICGNDRIDLHNYKGAKWELEDITFKDWSIRFVHSILLSYCLLDISIKRYNELVQNYGIERIEMVQKRQYHLTSFNGA